MVRVEFLSSCQAFGWWLSQKGSVETEMPGQEWA